MREDVPFNCCRAIFLHQNSSSIEELKNLAEGLKELPIEIVAYFKGEGIDAPRECLCSCIIDTIGWNGNNTLFLKPLDGYSISRIAVEDGASIRFAGKDDKEEKYILLIHNKSLFMISMESDTERKLRKSKEKINRLEKSLKQQREVWGRIEKNRNWENILGALGRMSSGERQQYAEIFEQTNVRQKKISQLLKEKSPEELERVIEIIKSEMRK